MNRNVTQNTSVVMDVLPWPNGCGFSGGDVWWQYTLSQSERERLDNLLGLALLDNKVCEQLVVKRDTSLLAAFDLSEETQRWLTRINASTLKEFAQAVLAAFNPYRDGAASEAA
ncbi:MAG: hypothetical protein ACYDEO_17705 [Aggregatilineales bacterium]